MDPLRLVRDEPTEADRLLTAQEVAEILNVRPKRVYELSLPTVELSPRCLRWRRSAILEWIAQRERRPAIRRRRKGAMA